MKTNRLRLLRLSIIAIVLSSFTSCDKDDAFKYEPYVRGVDTHWGYMNGNVYNVQTDETHSVSHQQHPSLIDRQRRWTEFKFYAELNKQVQFRHMTFFYNDKEAINYYADDKKADMLPSRSTINLTLVGDYKKGPVEIVDNENFVRREDGTIIRNLNSSIAIEIYDDAEKSNHWGVKPLRYIPRKDDPFFVYLDAVEFDKRNLDAPLLEGYISGTLYREDDPNDQIAVNMGFGM